VNLPAAQVQNRSRSLADKIAIAIATGFGAGYSPLAPGTVGSLLGVAIWLTAWSLSLHILLMASIAVALSWLGIWASSRAASAFNQKDPSQVVADEIAGQFIALAFIPASARECLLMLVMAGFLLFRVFDVIKPYPIYKLEALRAGAGIMADDILAGVYAGLLVLVLSFFC